MFRLASLSTGKHSLHLPANLHRLRGGIVLDVVPGECRALGDVALQLHLVRETDWQRALRRGVGGGHELAPDGVAAFAVEKLSRLERALRGGHAIASPAAGASRGL